MNTLPPIENHDINDNTVPLFQIMPKPKNKTRVSRDLNRATPFNKEYKNSVLLFDYDEGTQSKIGNTGKTLYTRQIEEQQPVAEDNLGDQTLDLPSLTPVPPIYPKTTFASTRIKRRTINPNKVTRNNTGGKKKKNKSKKRNRNKNSSKRRKNSKK